MRTSEQLSVKYKWDPRSGSGYVLSYESFSEAEDKHSRVHVKDWDHQVVVDEWDFESLSDAVMLLSRFFEIDVESESGRLRKKIEEQLAQAA